MDFAQHVGQGFGAGWRGVVFRRTYKQLADIWARSQRWFPRIFPGVTPNKQDMEWHFPEGETLMFRYLWNAADYENYHGSELPWMGFEELTNWGTAECYELMKSCSRSSIPGMPRKMRSTTNSYGVGYGWVKSYFIDAAPPCRMVGPPGLQRCHVVMDVEQNQALLAADPDYIRRLDAITDENLRKAWRYGSWDIVAGAYFAADWDPKVHIVEPFTIPAGWRIDRTHDWGESRPFCTLWFAESTGEALPDGRAWPRGTIFVVAEDYGWSGKPNEGIRLTAVQIAQRVKAIDGLFGRPVQPGAADLPAIRSGQSLEQDMANVGVRWLAPDKGPGSRVTGWGRIREYLQAAKASPRTEPGLLVFATCRNLIRTLPAAPHDERDPDEIDTDCEDHALDALRMRILSVKQAITFGRMRI